ncbi:hypothetical protein ICW40_07510 [Actinotalea ferrariae]|uniref:hypothetical protein n=1 Tax=Actinotalea ferrariae TaxID=1386098 RepID=UPI001C8CC372|nr:hypothetical protein [Actinotalea ferrariae]MBX9244656.1 hypothetical protein [Actinotalea ferrariae]
MTLEALTWSCAVCSKPVSDGAGFLTVDMPSVQEVDRAWDDFKRSHPRGYEVAELADMPEPVPWRAIHEACEVEGSTYSIEIAKVRTHAGLLKWTAHLMGKRWLSSTNWADVIDHQARGQHL